MNSQKLLEHSFLMTSEGLLRELSKVKPKKVVEEKVAVKPKPKPKKVKPKVADIPEEQPVIKEDMTHFNDHFETLIENEILREGLTSLRTALKREKKLFNEQLKHSQSELTEKIRLLEDDKKRLIQEQEELKANAETEQTETIRLAKHMQYNAGLNPYTNAEKQETSKDE
jgi:hypothetical protein